MSKKEEMNEKWESRAERLSMCEYGLGDQENDAMWWAGWRKGPGHPGAHAARSPLLVAGMPAPLLFHGLQGCGQGRLSCMPPVGCRSSVLQLDLVEVQNSWLPR